ncbi:MAG: hypothetical protein WD022_05235 [Balneolaceae bacterium]
MPKKENICNHCFEKKADHKKSHIIPEFIFRSGNIYDGNDHNLLIVDPYRKRDLGKSSTAPYEKYIFCKDCEKRHSAVESKASRILYHDDFDPETIKDSNAGLVTIKEFEEVNSDLFKHFLLLMLFRAEFSKRELFKQVKLGPYKERFRKILNNELPIEESGCYFYVFNFNNLLRNDLKRLSSPFHRMRVSGRKAYTIFLAGLGFIYHLNHPDVEILKDLEITGERGTKVNLITKKNAAKILLTSVFNVPEYIAREMLYS